MDDEVVITGVHAASPRTPSPPHPPPPSPPPSPPLSPPPPPSAWPPCNGTHAALRQGGNQPAGRCAASDFSIRHPAQLPTWLPAPLRPGLYTDPRQPAPADVGGTPAGVKVYPAFAESVFRLLGKTQDWFFRMAWEAVDGRREGRTVKSEKLTAAKLADATIYSPDFVSAVTALSGAVITSHYRPGYAEVHYVRLAFFSNSTQSSWHGDPAGCFDRHLHYFYAPTPGCFRAVQLATSQGMADANRPAVVAILGNGALMSAQLSFRTGNGLGSGGVDMLHQGLATSGCAGVWQMLFQTNVKLTAFGARQCGGTGDEEAQLVCARLATPSPAVWPGAVATVQPETSELITACVSSEPGFIWWGSNWGYYGGDVVMCTDWLGQTLDCLLRVERAHEGLLGSARAYRDNYRGGLVEALGCTCMLPDSRQMVDQATAAGDWWSRLGATDQLNHAFKWGWYLLHPTLAQRQDAVAAELEVCRFWLNQTLDCLLKVERAHEGLLGSRSAYSAKYRGGKVGAWAARACCPTTSGWWRRRRVLVTGTATTTGHGMPRTQRWLSARPRPSLSEGIGIFQSVILPCIHLMDGSNWSLRGR